MTELQQLVWLVAMGLRAYQQGRLEEIQFKKWSSPALARRASPGRQQ